MFLLNQTFRARDETTPHGTKAGMSVNLINFLDGPRTCDPRHNSQSTKTQDPGQTNRLDGPSHDRVDEARARGLRQTQPQLSGTEDGGLSRSF